MSVSGIYSQTHIQTKTNVPIIKRFLNYDVKKGKKAYQQEGAVFEKCTLVNIESEISLLITGD